VLVVKRHDGLLADEHYYHLVAGALADGYRFHVPHSNVPFGTQHPPLYPLLLAPITWLAAGSAVLAQRLVGAVIGSLPVVVPGLLGREVAGDRVGIAAAIVAAVTPTLWVNDGIVMSESLAALLVAVTLLLAYRYQDTPTLKRATGLGVACGLAALT